MMHKIIFEKCELRHIPSIYNVKHFSLNRNLISYLIGKQVYILCYKIKVSK